MMRRTFATACMTVLLAVAAPAWAQQAPDALVKEVSTEVMDTAREDKAIQQGDVQRVITLVDSKIMPHVNFERMTSAAERRCGSKSDPPLPPPMP